jgi:copper chaperone
LLLRYPLPVFKERLMTASSASPTRVYAVSGMTCEHCVMSVTEEVAEVAGVEGVSVDLPAGVLTVSGDGFSDEAVRAAVAEAGYEVVA